MACGAGGLFPDVRHFGVGLELGGAQRVGILEPGPLQRLAAEGLFAPERKRAIPRFVHRLGVVTSPTAAALRDVLAPGGAKHPIVGWMSGGSTSAVTAAKGGDSTIRKTKTPTQVKELTEVNADVLGVNEIENDGYGPTSAIADPAFELEAP